MPPTLRVCEEATNRLDFAGIQQASTFGIKNFLSGFSERQLYVERFWSQTLSLTTLAQVPFVLICADCELWRQRILSVRKIARHLELTSFYNHYQMRSIRFSNWSAHKLHDMLTGFAFAIAFTQNLSTICMSVKNLKDRKRQKRENRV